VSEFRALGFSQQFFLVGTRLARRNAARQGHVSIGAHSVFDVIVVLFVLRGLRLNCRRLWNGPHVPFPLPFSHSQEHLGEPIPRASFLGLFFYQFVSWPALEEGHLGVVFEVVLGVVGRATCSPGSSPEGLASFWCSLRCPAQCFLRSS
jgi:hypothetical protein